MYKLQACRLISAIKHVRIRKKSIFFSSIRSLQLTERSPNRTKMHKTVVQIGAQNPPKERQINRNVPVATRRATNNSNNNRLVITNDRQYKDIRNIDLEKSRSLDSEYEIYQSAGNEFDKSRSFDEKYTDSSEQIKYLDDNRSYRVDQVYTKYSKQVPNAQTKTNSPQNYGNRMYEHDSVYDSMSRKAIECSPLMNYKRDKQQQQQAQPQQSLQLQQQQQQSLTKHHHSRRERSPNLNREPIYRSMAKSFDHLQTAISSQPHQVLTSTQSMRDYSPSKRIVVNQSATLNASPSSDYDLNASDFNIDYGIRGNVKTDKDSKHVSEYYFGNKAKADAFLNQRRRESTKAISKTHLTGTASAAGRYLRN